MIKKLHGQSEYHKATAGRHQLFVGQQGQSEEVLQPEQEGLPNVH